MMSPLSPYEKGTVDEKRFADLGGEARGGSPEELRSDIESEIVKWKILIEARNIERQ